MFKYIFSIICLFIGLSLASNGVLYGKVTDESQKPLMGTQIWIINTDYGVVTNENGNYKIEPISPGEYKVVFQYIGFKSETLSVKIMQGEKVRRDVKLISTTVSGEPFEVTAERKTIHNKNTVQPTLVIPKEAANQAGASNLGEALQLDAGMKTQSKCSMCGSSQISIQGLPGRYSLILFDGMPVMSGIASKYILGMFPVDFMDRVEVVKGASGALWGSGAVAGAINVIPPNPLNGSSMQTSIKVRSFGNDLSGVFSNNTKYLGLTTMMARSERKIVDYNGDGVTENNPYIRNMYLMNLHLYPSLLWDVNFGGTFIDSDRHGGKIVSDAELIDNPDAEKISTEHWDAWNETGYTSGILEAKIRAIFSSHKENGIADAASYSTNQKTTYGELSGKLYSSVELEGGISFQREELSDTRLFESYLVNDWGLWLSAQKNILGIDLMGAGRLDLNSDYGSIFSPYLGAKTDFAGFTWNIAAGTGFNAPSMLFQDLEHVPGGFLYAIRKDENLSEEKALSVEGRLSRMIMMGSSSVNITTGLFYHRAKNFITGRFDGIDTTTGKDVFLYYNEDEYITSTGGEVSAAFMFPHNIDLNLGGFLLSPTDNNGKILTFINRYGVNYSLSHRMEILPFKLTIDGVLNGPMRIETVLEDSSFVISDSPVYATVNLKAKKHFGNIIVKVGLNNIFDYSQDPNTEGDTEY